MAHVIHTAQQVRAEIRLEERTGADTFEVDVVFIRIKDIDMRIRNQATGNLE